MKICMANSLVAAQKFIRFTLQIDLKEANRRFGIPSAILRAGAIGPNTETGELNYEANHHTFFCAIANSCKVPSEVPNYGFDWIPVNYCAKAVIIISSFKLQVKMDLYHLNNPKGNQAFSMLDVINALTAFGHEKKLVDQIDWKESLIKSTKSEVDSFIISVRYEKLVEDCLFWACPKTIQVLSGTNMKCPEYDEEALHRIFKYSIEKGFIKVK